MFKTPVGCKHLHYRIGVPRMTYEPCLSSWFTSWSCGISSTTKLAQRVKAVGVERRDTAYSPNMARVVPGLTFKKNLGIHSDSFVACPVHHESDIVIKMINVRRDRFLTRTIVIVWLRFWLLSRRTTERGCDRVAREAFWRARATCVVGWLSLSSVLQGWFVAWAIWEALKAGRLYYWDTYWRQGLLVRCWISQFGWQAWLINI